MRCSANSLRASWLWGLCVAAACSLKMPDEGELFAPQSGQLGSTDGGASQGFDATTGRSVQGDSASGSANRELTTDGRDSGAGGNALGHDSPTGSPNPELPPDGQELGAGGSTLGHDSAAGSLNPELPPDGQDSGTGGSVLGRDSAAAGSPNPELPPDGQDGGAGGSAPNGGAGGSDQAGDENSAEKDAGPVDPDDGLVAHFAFDKATTGAAVNSTDPTRNGTCVGSMTWPKGRIGGAVGIRNLEGLTATTDWIELPKGLLSDLSATTVSLWVRDLSTARQGARLFDFSLGAAEQLYFSPDQVNPKTSVQGAHLSGTHAGSPFVDSWTTNPLTDKAWHHVAVAWSAASINLYIDGRKLGSRTSPGVLPSDLGATSPNWLGRAWNDAFLGLYAEIDDLRVYNRALTAEEIAQLYRMP